MIARLRHVWSPSIRTQLTLLYATIFTLLILLFGSILYLTLQSFLAAGLDSALQLRAQQIAGGISSENGRIIIQDVTGELPGIDATATAVDLGDAGSSLPAKNPTKFSPPAQVIQSDVNIGTLVRILNLKGQVSYVSPAFRALTPPDLSIRQPLSGTSWKHTITAYDGQSVRLYSFALTDNGVVFGVLQVGESLARLTATLQSVTVVLFAITPFMFLLGSLISYGLAKRAFKPILNLTHTARAIKAGDLHRRVPVPSAKDEVHELALTINEMIERLDGAFTQQRRFVADASHELRTPVAVIRSITDVALDGPLTIENCINVLHEINAESARLGSLINDLLTLASADEEQIPLDHEPVRLDLLALDVVASMEPLAFERHINLQVEAPTPVMIVGDMARLIQMMMGLVDNALTYTNPAGTVTLSVGMCDAHATFSVCDTGIGISPEDMQHIFERFYRADRARSRTAGGSGLGLSLADWVVRAHGGSITMVSREGLGSTFTVSLPLAPSQYS